MLERKKAKISESRNHGIFLVRYRRTYDLKKRVQQNNINNKDTFKVHSTFTKINFKETYFVKYEYFTHLS